MEMQRHNLSFKESTAVRQFLGLAAPPLEASNLSYDMMMSLYRPYHECPPQLEGGNRYAHTESNSVEELILKEPSFIQSYHSAFTERRNGNRDDDAHRNLPTDIPVRPSYLSDLVHDKPHENYPHYSSLLDRYELFENNHPFAKNNCQVVQNDALSSTHYGELDFDRTTELLTNFQRQLVSRPNYPPFSRQNPRTSRTVTMKTNGNANTKLPNLSKRNIESDNVERETRFRNINDHSPFQSSERLPDPENLECSKGKKELELDVASTLCSLSIIQPEVVDEQNIEIERSAGGDSSQSVAEFPTRLSMPNDESELNSLHCFVRKELLELFVYKREEISLAKEFAGSEDDFDDDCNNKEHTSTSPHDGIRTHIFNASSLADNDISNDSLRVGLRCVHCAHLHKTSSFISCAAGTTESSVLKNTNLRMNAIYPKSVTGIYRLVCKWQRVHFKKCKHIPP